MPRDQMSAEALAVWDRAVGDLRAAGATVEPFTPAVTLWDVRDAFAAAAGERGDVPVDPRSPAPTANALYLYFAGRTDRPREAVRRGYAAYRAFYDVLPESFEDCEPLLQQPMADDPAGRSFARSRARVVAALADVHARRGRRGDGLPDHALQRAPRHRFVAPHPHRPGLRQLARPAGGVRSGGDRCRRDAGAQPVRRGAAGRRRAGAGAGARLRAQSRRFVAPPRGTGR